MESNIVMFDAGFYKKNLRFNCIPGKDIRKSQRLTYRKDLSINLQLVNLRGLRKPDDP